MKYFEIKPNTRQYNLATKIYTSKSEWNKKEVCDDLENAIGILVDKNLECNPLVLRLSKIPEGTRDQFKKSRTNMGCYTAKSYSDLNRRYLEVVKKHNLISYGMFEFTMESGLYGFIHSLCPIKNGDSILFFVEVKSEISNDDLQKLRERDYLTEIKESEYLILKAEMIKEQEKREEKKMIQNEIH